MSVFAMAVPMSAQFERSEAQAGRDEEAADDRVLRALNGWAMSRLSISFEPLRIPRDA